MTDTNMNNVLSHRDLGRCYSVVCVRASTGVWPNVSCPFYPQLKRGYYKYRQRHASAVMSLALIRVLLAMGGVELNPGPPSKGGRRGGARVPCALEHEVLCDQELRYVGRTKRPICAVCGQPAAVMESRVSQGNSEVFYAHPAPGLRLRLCEFEKRGKVWFWKDSPVYSDDADDKGSCPPPPASASPVLPPPTAAATSSAPAASFAPAAAVKAPARPVVPAPPKPLPIPRPPPLPKRGVRLPRPRVAAAVLRPLRGAFDIGSYLIVLGLGTLGTQITALLTVCLAAKVPPKYSMSVICLGLALDCCMCAVLVLRRCFVGPLARSLGQRVWANVKSRVRFLPVPSQLPPSYGQGGTYVGIDRELNLPVVRQLGVASEIVAEQAGPEVLYGAPLPDSVIYQGLLDERVKLGLAYESDNYLGFVSRHFIYKADLDVRAVHDRHTHRESAPVAICQITLSSDHYRRSWTRTAKDAVQTEFITLAACAIANETFNFVFGVPIPYMRVFGLVLAVGLIVLLPWLRRVPCRQQVPLRRYIPHLVAASQTRTRATPGELENFFAGAIRAYNISPDLAASCVRGSVWASLLLAASHGEFSAWQQAQQYFC